MSDEPKAAPKRPPPPMIGRGFGMQMGPPQKPKNAGATAKRLIRRLAPERPLLVLVIALSVIAVGLNVSGPKILGKATNLIFAGFLGSTGNADSDFGAAMGAVNGVGVDFEELAGVLALVMALYAGASLFQWLQGYALNFVVQRTVNRLRNDVDAKLMRVPLAYFDGQQHGEVLSRATNDIDNVAVGLQQTLGQLLVGLLTVVGILVMLIWISWVLALIALVTVPLSLVITAKIAKRAQKEFVAQWKHVGTLNGQIEEAFTGHALVKVFGRRGQIERTFGAKNEELYQAGFRAQFVSSIIMPAINFVGNLTYVAIAVVGGLRVASGTMLLGSVQAFIQYSRQFSQQLGQLASVANIVQSGLASAERVFEVLDAAEQAPETDEAELAKVTGEVRFADVSFRYKPDVPLIDGLSLVAKPGQTVAIVGPTGAGKTTLVNLLMRFYELDKGAILIDGVDIAKLPRRELRAKLGMVLQDTWLFGGTIRANLAYGNPSASEEQIMTAAKAAYVDRFVRALPAGYDTVIDEESSNLSAGEKQLITIARAFLSDPPILILDEATSSVDTRTEVLVQDAMAALRKKRTSFVIAHRLSTIRNADLILVMEHGNIVEQGTHDELLAKHGVYYRLHNAAT